MERVAELPAAVAGVDQEILHMRSHAAIAALVLLYGIVCAGSVAARDDATHSLSICVSDTAGLHTRRGVTGGVPLPAGAAPAGSHFRLYGEDHQPVPCQIAILARWEDDSARWVLLDFQAEPPAHGTSRFQLVWGAGAAGPSPDVPVVVHEERGVTVASGAVELATIDTALLRISERLDLQFVLTDQEGQRCVAQVESSTIETAGTLRSTLLLTGSFRTPAGGRVVGFRLRASVYAGLPRVCLEPQILIDAEQGMIQHIRDLSIEFVSRTPLHSAALGGAPGWTGSAARGSPVRLLQVDDENYRLEGASGTGGQAPGWLEWDDGQGPVAVALRDFWQQWPKSLEVDGRAVRLGLFPRFEAGTFAHMGPWYKHDYLFDGNTYRLRQGQTRRWQIWVDLAGHGESLAQMANQPCLPAADPVQALGTGQWGYVAPAGSPGMEDYDQWAERLFEGYCRSIREQRDYGAMNWGDWWGERNCNWGNHEYDTPLHMLIQFARTGDPRYFIVAEQAARHYSEVDVVHFVNDDLKQYFAQWESEQYPSRPGMVHEHSIGHVGGFHPVEKIHELYVELKIGSDANPYLCLDPFNLGHIFTLGMAHYYLLSGDPWIKETIERIGDNLMRLAEDGKFQFKGWNHVGRVNGWTMLALAGLYKIDPSERCLNAMRHLADEALVEQDPHCGGWLYQLGSGHCNCVTRKHVGEAGFITSVRLNGLSYYYRLTGDERIPASLQRGVTHLNRDTWVEEWSDWRYTSCPASSAIRQTGVTIMALVNSVRLTGDAEHLRILRQAWDARYAQLRQAPRTQPGLGKTYSTIMYGAPEAMNLFVNGVDAGGPEAGMRDRP